MIHAAGALIAVTWVLLQAPIMPPVWLFLPVLAAALLLRQQRATLLLLALQVFNVALDARSWEVQRLRPECERRPLTVEGRVTGLPRVSELPGAMFYQANLAVTAIHPRDCDGPARISLYLPSAHPPAPGDLLRLAVRLKVPWGQSNPRDGGGSQRGYFERGLHALGGAREVTILEPGADHVVAAVDRVRSQVTDKIGRAVHSEVAAALLQAVLIGDRRQMGDAHWRRLREFGLTHLLVISGMHVSLVALLGAGTGTLLLRLLAPLGIGPGRRMLIPMTALLFAAAYTVLSGAGLPALRALLMLAPALTLLALGRQSDGWRYWSLALITVALLQPRSLLGASFWLSFGAVALLLWLGACRPARSWVANLGGTQLYMTLAMLPLSLLWFGGASLLGAIANLVAVPLVTLCIVPLGLAGVVFSMFSEALAALCWSIAAVPLEVLWIALENMARDFDGWLYFQRTPPPRSALVLCLLAGLALPLPLWRLRLAALVTSAALLLIPAAARDDTEILFFDVGQGTAVLARAGGRAVLYDTGPSGFGGAPRAERVILPYLRGVGVGALDLLVISHFDSDHSGGLQALEATLGFRRRWAGSPGLPGFETCRAGRRLMLGPIEVTVLSTARRTAPDNNQSCVLLLEVDGLRILLPGDIDRAAERDLVAYWGDALRADVLLAPHHGSGSSSSRLFLRHVAPQHVVASNGRANRFGHPARSVREATAARGAVLWENARHGAVRLRPLETAVWRLSPTRHPGQPFWRQESRQGSLWATFKAPEVILRAAEKE